MVATSNLSFCAKAQRQEQNGSPFLFKQLAQQMK